MLRTEIWNKVDNVPSLLMEQYILAMSWPEYLLWGTWYNGLNWRWKLLEEGGVRVTFWIVVQPLLSLSVGIYFSFFMGRAASVNITPKKRFSHCFIYVYEVLYILNSKTGNMYKSIGLLLDWCTPPGNCTG